MKYNVGLRQGLYEQSHGNFYASNIGTIDAAGTWGTASGSIAIGAIPPEGCISVDIFGEGNTPAISDNINVDFTMCADPDGDDWQTETFQRFSLGLTGTDTQREGFLLSTAGYNFVRVERVTNESSTIEVDDINVVWSMKV